MELWVSGFNAWGQLEFQGDSSTEPQDVRTFRSALRSHYIEIQWTALSATLIWTSSGLKSAGSPDEIHQLYLAKDDGLPSIAIAGNEKVAEIRGSSIIEYGSREAYIEDEGQHRGDFEEFEQIVANQTTFTALSKSGKVWTWGDGRYESCLGREVSEQSPAELPSIIEDLSDLPTGSIRKISSGGYVTAALTSGNDLYIWGGRPGQPKILEQLSGTPEPVDLDGQDILDVAIGADHILALTSEHKLYVVGANKNGQLGLDVEELNDWKKVALQLGENQRVVNVHAGYKNSFLIVQDIDQ